MANKSISIKFCGGCNPKIDRGHLAATVRDILSRHGYNVIYNKLDADVIIYVSGCTANCAWRYGSANSPHVVVAGAAIDALATGEEDLVTEIISKVKAYLE